MYIACVSQSASSSTHVTVVRWSKRVARSGGGSFGDALPFAAVRFAAVRFAAVLFGALLVNACAETPVDLLWSEEGSPVEPGTGGVAGSASWPTGGAVGQGGQGGAPEPCTSEGEHYRLRQGETLCLRRGAPTTIAQDPAFFVELAPCDQSAEALWSVLPAGPAFEVRNQDSGDNLDIRLAATGDGTTAVLYEPHQLYNQRFFLRSGPAAGTEASPEGGERWIAPRHADTKCLTAFPEASTGQQVQLWPCEGVRADQHWVFERLACP